MLNALNKLWTAFFVAVLLFVPAAVVSGLVAMANPDCFTCGGQAGLTFWIMGVAAHQPVLSVGKARQLAAAELSAARVFEELRRLSFIDGRSFWTARGRLKLPHELTAEQGAALASFEALIKNAKAGDQKTDLIHKVRLHDKIRALETLAKHFGLLKDQRRSLPAKEQMQKRGVASPAQWASPLNRERMDS